MSIPNEAIEAVHGAICEESLEDHMDPDWPGRCVKAVRAAVPFIAAEALRDEAGRLAQLANIHPATNLWSVVDSMRNRAARIESPNA